MKKLTSKQIRQLWLDFFKSKDHLVLESKSLIPINDPSLLWINSGVATLKDYFSGKKIPPYPRITNSQKSIRTNDIENVGITTRHHTFFEMLGNFSIGNYFKKEAIEFAYEFIFKELEFAKDDIYITYYSEDTDTLKYWLELGISKDHMIEGTRDTNFWDVGQGPCGPDTEIFFDRGPKYDKRSIELIKEDIENDRFIEIWNIVFSQFNNDGENNYTELAHKNIDTGAGLERISSILQDVPTNFDTDLFQIIIKEIEKYTDYKYDINNYFTKEPNQTKINTQFKIIADHIRACVNAINDGVKPSNVGRGYIIRRLIRRSYRSMLKLGIKETAFLYKLVDVTKQSLIYDIDVNLVSEIIKEEELLFSKTINQGEKLLEREIEKNGNISTEIAFKMFDTYGFPIELTNEILAEKNLHIDQNEFNKYLEIHKQKSRGNVGNAMDKVISSLDIITKQISEFTGYEETTHQNAKILYLLNDFEEIEQTNNDDDISYVVLNKTPFYATSGGQFHDFGIIKQGDNDIEILDVFKDKYWNHIHKVKGKIQANMPVDCFVDEKARQGYMRNHSSTHIMFSALRKTYQDEKIEQLGSSIMPEYFTFDFPHDKKPTPEEIKNIENIMHQYIKDNVQRQYKIMTIKEAEEIGAFMTIEENEYHDQSAVRVVIFDPITKDLCGGTHSPNTAFIEDFKITGVENKGTGIYRLRVVTSNILVRNYLLKEIEKYQEIVNSVILKNKELDKNYSFELPNINLNQSNRDLEKEIDNLKDLENKVREEFKILFKQSQNTNLDLEDISPQTINNKPTILLQINNMQDTKKAAIELREKFTDALVITATLDNNKCFVVVASKIYNSNDLLKQILTKYQGKGGGNAIVSQGSFTTDYTIEDIFKDIKENILCEN
ncbi:alanine--tRNA ligase [Mycoplasma zalophi]|uniref:alanine--tRNA ligase n=1 Tax=Mycoplasma zalophi TaxID=191287 RepID=UPI001C10ECCB|nr:alanine--tRNA ligase [Mycoplasma zalophi]MBU4690774.1 alanine--tRNA ligase [Mycoplasma zalophi]